MSDLTATLEFLEGAQWVCLSRVDVAPTSPHTNVHYKQLHIPPAIPESHFHDFKDNVRLGMAAFAPRDNLPAARPIEPEPASFREFLAIVGGVFNIDGAAELPRPDWQGGFI